MAETQSSRTDEKNRKSPFKRFKEKIQTSRVETIQGIEVEHRIIPLWMKLLILLILILSFIFVLLFQAI